MPSDFTVHPLGGLDVGAKLESVIEGGKSVYRQKQIKEQLPKIVRSGDPDKIAEFMAEYPEAADTVKGIRQYKSDVADESLVNAAMKTLSGELQPHEALAEHIKIADAEGEDVTSSVSHLGEAIENPEEAKRKALLTLAWKRPDLYKQYMAATAGRELTETEKEYQTAKTDGFEGSFLEYKLAAGGKDKTDAIKEFEYGVKNPSFIVSENQKKEAEATKELSQKTFKNSMDLRKEYLSQSKDYQKVRDAYTRVKSSTAEPSPAGDLSLIFNYMKMLDPGSVVRESEFATAAATGSYGERIQASVQKVISGERLTDAMRNDFISKSNQLFKGAERQHKRRVQNYTGIAKKNKLPVDEVVVDITENTEQEMLPEGVTEEDIQHTMEKHGVSREEVLKRIGGNNAS